MDLVRVRSRWVVFLLLACFAALPSRAVAVRGAETGAVGPTAIDRPLIAHWGFDEQLGNRCRDASGNGYDASPERGASGLRRIQGLFGGAMSFSGKG